MTRMGAAGRVVIPADVRRAMQVSEGDPLIVVPSDEGLLLMTPAQAARRAQRLVREHIGRDAEGGCRPLSEELIQERRREAELD